MKDISLMLLTASYDVLSWNAHPWQMHLENIGWNSEQKGICKTKKQEHMGMIYEYELEYQNR